MRSILGLAVFLVSVPAWNAAYPQNELRGGGQPAAAGSGTPAGGEEVPTGQFGPGQPGAGAGQGAPGGRPGAPMPIAANDPTYHAQVSYALGRNFAMNLKENQVQPDLQALLAGINDALTGAQPRWSDQQLDAVLQRFSREMQQKEMARMQQEAAKNQQEEAAFLAQNGKRQDVQTTPTGLQYRVLQQGKGAMPTLNDVVKCNYRGTLLNGTEFDSSARSGGPAEFPLKRVIPGWTEALQKMHVGDKWQLFVPAKLAYGMDPPGPPIEAGSMLVFEIELLDIVKQ
jgi:FKBP-type peptidyl-prolyl cis-trans isomerase